MPGDPAFMALSMPVSACGDGFWRICNTVSQTAERTDREFGKARICPLTAQPCPKRSAAQWRMSRASVVVQGPKGSAPRPAGTSMLVWDGGPLGTIGGGQLELQSMRDAAP